MRIRFLLTVVLVTLLTGCGNFWQPRQPNPDQPGATRFAYVSNYNDNTGNQPGSVSQFRINNESGALTSIGAAVEAGVGTAWLAVSNQRFLYAVNDAGTISAFSINASTGALTRIGTEIPVLPGVGPVAAAATTNFLFVANATTQDLLVFRIDTTNGTLTQLQGVQLAGGPSAVEVAPNGNFIYVAVGPAGTDVFRVATDGALTRVRTVPPLGGGSAEGVAIAPAGGFLYVAQARTQTQLGPVGTQGIAAYRVGTNGDLTAIATEPYAAGDTPLAVTVEPGGKYVYAANQLSDNVSGYLILTNGALTPVSGSPFTAGGTPVSLRVEPSGNFLYVVNFDGGPDVSIFRVDNSAATPGRLTLTGNAASGTDPSYIVIR